MRRAGADRVEACDGRVGWCATMARSRPLPGKSAAWIPSACYGLIASPRGGDARTLRVSNNAGHGGRRPATAIDPRPGGGMLENSTILMVRHGEKPGNPCGKDTKGDYDLS